MVKPSKKKEVVGYLKKRYQVGIKKCCSIVGISKSTWYYESKLDDSEIVEALGRMVAKKGNRGFDNYYYRLRREGFKWARCRVLRVYRALGLVRRPKRRRKLPAELRVPLREAIKLNEVWSMDFMSDSLDDGRKFRTLNIIDDHNRECLLVKGSISYPAKRVKRELDLLVEQYGKPEYIRTDNGPEFLSKEYKDWCTGNGVKRLYSNPGRPMENGYVERFNRTFREDILDAYMFTSINHVNMLAEIFMEDYNNYHPHDSLGKKSPKEFAHRREPLVSFIKDTKGS